MRKFLMVMTVLASAATAPGAHATPAALPGSPQAAMPGGIQAQPVQYYGDDWRYREFRRREAYERFRRHEAWREWRREREYGHGYGHGGGYGYGHGGGYGRY